MRLDHMAYRVRDRYQSAKFFTSYPFEYRIQTEFEIPELNTRCLVLVPPEKADLQLPFFSNYDFPSDEGVSTTHYHLAPEIFISSSPDKDSPVGQWVEARNGGGIHHIAYNV